MPSASTTIAVSATATPTSAMMPRAPTIVASLSGKTRVLSVFPVDTPQQDDTVLRLVLLLGVVVPLLLITAATLWLSVKWLINRQRLVSTTQDNSDELMKPRG